MMPARILSLFRDSQNCLRTKKNMDALAKKAHQEKEIKGE
jgi:hypothetical protein